MRYIYACKSEKFRKKIFFKIFWVSLRVLVSMESTIWVRAAPVQCGYGTRTRTVRVFWITRAKPLVHNFQPMSSPSWSYFEYIKWTILTNFMKIKSNANLQNIAFVPKARPLSMSTEVSECTHHLPFVYLTVLATEQTYLFHSAWANKSVIRQLVSLRPQMLLVIVVEF